MVNGAQGDDDEAHGGHFALVTGRVQADGAIGDWLVNNFYTLDCRKRERASSRRRCRSTTISPISTRDRTGTGRRTCSSRCSRAARRGAAPVRARPRVQPVLPPPARLRPPDDELHQHQRRHAARARLAGPGARSDAIACSRGLALPARAARALARKGAARVRLPRRGPDPAAACGGVRGDRASLLALARRSARPCDGSLARDARRGCRRARLLRFPQLPSSRAWGDAPAVTMREYRTRLPRDPEDCRSFRCRRARFRRRCAIPICCRPGDPRPKSPSTCGPRFPSSAFPG